MSKTFELEVPESAEDLRAIALFDAALHEVLRRNDELPEGTGDAYRLPADISERLTEIRNDLIWLELFQR